MADDIISEIIAITLKVRSRKAWYRPDAHARIMARWEKEGRDSRLTPIDWFEQAILAEEMGSAPPSAWERICMAHGSPNGP